MADPQHQPTCSVCGAGPKDGCLSSDPASKCEAPHQTTDAAVAAILAKSDIDILADELEAVRAQRDALALVVGRCWDAATDGMNVDGNDIHEWMAEAGLVEEGEATAEEAASRGDEFEEGDPWLRFTDLGRAAMKGAGT